MFPQAKLQHGKPLSQALLLQCVHLVRPDIFSPDSIIFRLPAGQWRHPLHSLKQCLGNFPPARRCYLLYHLFRLDMQQIQFIALGRRQLINHTRQNLPYTGHLRVNPFHCVDNPAVLIHQYNIGMPPHDFHCKRQFHQISQFIDRLKNQMQNPVHPHLFDPNQSCRPQMLAQQHAEHGRLFWIFRRLPGKMDPGTSCIR